jgi:5-formyltetrahydrofolate cyclo-ligase
MSRKAETRRIALEIRRGLPQTHRQVADQAILAAAVRLAAGTRQIAAYVPMPGEPGGPGLVDALSAVTEVILPVLRPDRDLDWARYAGPACLQNSVCGGTYLREPGGILLGLDAISGVDLILVPALAVDSVGTRLGRGGGSYDRALARVTADMPVVALLYDGEPHPTLPAEPHDRVVTAVLSPAGFQKIRMS